jgi:hypothetical protein
MGEKLYRNNNLPEMLMIRCHDFFGAWFTTYIAWTKKSPRHISQNQLTRWHTFFIFTCFKCGLNSGCWATNKS